MKTCFLPEGDREVEFIRKYFSKYHPGAKLIDSDLVFTEETARAREWLYFIDLPEGVERIPDRLNSIYDRIRTGGCVDFLIVCDVEVELGCPLARKTRIRETLSSHINSEGNIRYIFSCPYIEEIYWDHPNVIKKVMKTFFEDSFFDQRAPQFTLPNKPKSDFDTRLVKLFKKYNLHLNNEKFAHLFFSELNYSRSRNSTVKRLHSALNRISKRVI